MRRGQPSYARLWELGEFPEVHTATATGFGHDVSGWSSGTRRSRRRTSLRVEDTRDIIARRGETSKEEAQITPDAEGVVATIPQFLALLHASRSTIEQISSTPVTTAAVETEGGERVRAVSLRDAPKGSRHRGRDVHVVVLVPDGAKWAKERIFWTHHSGALGELWQKKYRDVISSERVSTRPHGRAYDRDWDARSLSSLSLGPRTARW